MIIISFPSKLAVIVFDWLRKKKYHHTLLSFLEEEILIRKDDEKLINSGLSIWAAALTMFCIGFGTGTVTIPYTTKLVGLPLAFVILLTVFALCTLGSLLLCYSYNIVFKDVDHKTTIIRAPYGDMMERAFGQIGRIVHVVMFITCLLLLCVGFLSVLANTLDSLARNVVEEYPFILPFWAWCLLPTLIVMWGVLIRSPKGFVWISVFSGVTSILVACIIAIACFLVYSRSNLKTTIQEKGDDSGIFEKCNAIFTSAGVIAFAWCFQYTIPSIQTDMSNPNHASKSSLVASLSLLFGYSISTIVAYLLIRGDLLKQSMIDTFIDLDLYTSDAGFKTVVTLIQLFFICHLLSVLIPVINPLCQQMDEILGLPVSKCG